MSEEPTEFNDSIFFSYSCIYQKFKKKKKKRNREKPLKKPSKDNKELWTDEMKISFCN